MRALDSNLHDASGGARRVVRVSVCEKCACAIIQMHIPECKSRLWNVAVETTCIHFVKHVLVRYSRCTYQNTEVDSEMLM